LKQELSIFTHIKLVLVHTQYTYNMADAALCSAQ